MSKLKAVFFDLDDTLYTSFQAGDQHAGDRHTLHLTSGQIKRISIAILPDIKKLQGVLHPLLHLFGRNSQVLHSESDFLIYIVLCSGQLVKRILEHQTHMTTEL